MNLPTIQQYIISQLKNAGYLRYRDMHPQDDTPNDLYNYHLKSLIKKGLVEKTEEGYILSQDGQRYVADVWHTSDESQRLFKINVITIISRINDGTLEILNQRRTSQPSYGIVGVPGGTILKGEPLLEGASRKLEQETGLRAAFELVGIERRFYYKNNELFSDVLFPICYCNTFTGSLLDKTEFGENFWVSINEAIANDSREDDQIESIAIFLKSLKVEAQHTNTLFYRETTISI